MGGPICNDCRPDHYNFTSEGCTPCGCSQFFTSPFCNVITGQCACPDGVTGLTCDMCLPNYFLTTQGCELCACDQAGSLSSTCNQVTGQCECMEGLTGRKCDRCSDGFFNTGGRGGREVCSKCVCSGRGSTCSLSSQNGTQLAIQYDFSELCSTDSVSCSDGWRFMTLSGDETAVLTP